MRNLEAEKEAFMAKYERELSTSMDTSSRERSKWENERRELFSKNRELVCRTHTHTRPQRLRFC